MMQPPPSPSFPDSDVSEAPSLIRTYRAWKGQNVFFLKGRLIFGPDVKYPFVVIFLISAPIAVFCVFVARKLLDDFPGHSGWSIMIIVIVLTLFVLITLLLTSGRDPGIVPRNAHPPEPDDNDGTANINNGLCTRRSLPRMRDVTVNGITMKTKYCDTCMLYRPLRCSHCSICDNCVERFDHHCPYLGQCIGLRNYRFYFMFVFSATLLCLFVHGFCWVYIRRIKDSEEISIWKAMIKTPASVALIIYTVPCLWFVGGLTAFHTYLISTNKSTYENYKSMFSRQGNPFDRGIVENFREVFCTSIPPSRNNFRSKIPKETSDTNQREGDWSLNSMMMKSTRDMELVRRPVYNDESDNRDGFTNEEYSKDSGITDMSLDLSMTLHSEGEQEQNYSYHRGWGRTSRKWKINPEDLDSLPEVGESNWFASEIGSGHNENSTNAIA